MSTIMFPFAPSDAALMRFFKKVDAPTEHGCWIWKGASAPANGNPLTRYGKFCADIPGPRRRTTGRRVAASAHRVAYFWHTGAVPIQCLDHVVCNTSLCVNPRHVKATTYRENVLRGESYPAQQARKTECKRGHPFDEANTYRQPGRPLGRACFRCRRDGSSAKNRAYYLANRERLKAYQREYRRKRKSAP